MTTIHLEIDIAETEGDDAWPSLDHPDQITDSWFGNEEGSSGPCHHGLDEPHDEGEWCGAWVECEPEHVADVLNVYRRQHRVLSAWAESTHA